MNAPSVSRVFLTGASSGIGAALARRYAVPGATIGLVARRAELLSTLAGELRSRGATAHVLPGDVSDTEGMGAAALAFLDAAGGVDLVVANAGVGIPSALDQGDAKSVARLMQINVIGVTNTIIPFIPAVIAQKSGVLVAVSSMAGHRGLPGRVAYSSSKAAVITFMDGLRMELHGTGAHAMTICPGFVKTPMTDVLDHKMPFLVDVEKAVDWMIEAIDRHDRTFTFPWQMRMLRHVMVNAPEWLLRRAAPAARRKGTIGEA
jgi:short-subunit dehydrogenase